MFFHIDNPGGNKEGMATPELHFGAGLVLGAAETASEALWLEDLGYEYLSAGEHFMRVIHPALPTPRCHCWP